MFCPAAREVYVTLLARSVRGDADAWENCFRNFSVRMHGQHIAEAAGQTSPMVITNVKIIDGTGAYKTP